LKKQIRNPNALLYYNNLSQNQLFVSSLVSQLNLDTNTDYYYYGGILCIIYFSEETSSWRVSGIRKQDLLFEIQACLEKFENIMSPTLFEYHSYSSEQLPKNYGKLIQVTNTLQYDLPVISLIKNTYNTKSQKINLD
jgi:hypothetical protein